MQRHSFFSSKDSGRRNPFPKPVNLDIKTVSEENISEKSEQETDEEDQILWEQSQLSKVVSRKNTKFSNSLIKTLTESKSSPKHNILIYSQNIIDKSILDLEDNISKLTKLCELLNAKVAQDTTELGSRLNSLLYIIRPDLNHFNYFDQNLSRYYDPNVIVIYYFLIDDNSRLSENSKLDIEKFTEFLKGILPKDEKTDISNFIKIAESFLIKMKALT